MYTLADYFKASGVKEKISFSKEIKMHFKPRKDQVDGLKLCLQNKRFGLYDDPGVGKTVISQAYCIYWVANGAKVVVVMPPVLLYQFRESFTETYIGIEEYIEIHIHDKPPAKRIKEEEYWNSKEGKWPDVICMSYQMFQKYHEKLKKSGYDILVADEAHALKNPVSGIHLKVKKFLGDHDLQANLEQSALLLMTGTPIPNLLNDAYGLIKLTNPDAYLSYKSFERQHCLFKNVTVRKPRVVRGRIRETSSMRILDGFKNKEKINETLYRYGRRVLKTDVLSLKEPMVTEVPVKLSDKHLNVYRKLAREKLLAIGEGGGYYPSTGAGS